MREPRLLVLLVALTLGLTGTPSAGGLDVVTTTSDLGWFVEAIGGERVDVAAIARGYQDPHYIEPKPSYLVKMSRADALVYVGLGIKR